MLNTLFHSDPNSPVRANTVALILRISLGAIFLFHGLDKIIQGEGGASWVNQMYNRQPVAPSAKMQSERAQAEHQVPASLTYSGTQLAVAWGEFLGGLALVLGLLTRLAALGMIIIQAGAIYLVTAPRGFRFDRGGGYEYNIALLAMCLAVLILGPGIWSIDGAVTRKRRAVATGTAAPPPPLAGPHVPISQPVEQVAAAPPQTM